MKGRCKCRNVLTFTYDQLILKCKCGRTIVHAIGGWILYSPNDQIEATQ